MSRSFARPPCLDPRPLSSASQAMSLPPGQRGIGVVAILAILVVLAALASAVARLAGTQQTSWAQDVLAARVLQAANAGIEWGLYQAYKAGQCVINQPQSFALPDAEFAGIRVSVECHESTYYENGLDYRSFYLVATACTTSQTHCPLERNDYSPNPSSVADPSAPFYIERRRVATVYCKWISGQCQLPD